MPGEDDYYRDAENIEFTAANANVNITINVPGTGTETETTKYLNKGSLGTGFVLTPSIEVSIIQIGSKIFRNPITVSTAGISWTKKIKDFSKIVIRPSTDATNINLLVL